MEKCPRSAPHALETACLPGDHINERSCAIRDRVVAGDLRRVRRRRRAGRGASLLTCCRRLCSTARARAWCQTSPPPRARASRRRRQARRLEAASAEAERHDGRQDALGGSLAVSRGAARAVEPARGARGAERARKVHVDYVLGRARALDHAHSRHQADGTPYPGAREQVLRGSRAGAA